MTTEFRDLSSLTTDELEAEEDEIRSALRFIVGIADIQLVFRRDDIRDELARRKAAPAYAEAIAALIREAEYGDGDIEFSDAWERLVAVHRNATQSPSTNSE